MERRLVELAMHGDEEAFDTLIGRVGDSLHSVARRILRDTTLAEDATQEALLHAWRSLPALRDPRPLRGVGLSPPRERMSCAGAPRTSSSGQPAAAA